MARKKVKTLEENEFNRAVGARIRHFRWKRRLTQAQLARSGDTSDAQLGYYESGEARCTLFRIVKFARRLGVRIDELVPSQK